MSLFQRISASAAALAVGAAVFIGVSTPPNAGADPAPVYISFTINGDRGSGDNFAPLDDVTLQLYDPVHYDALYTADWAFCTFDSTHAGNRCTFTVPYASAVNNAFDVTVAASSADKWTRVLTNATDVMPTVRNFVTGTIPATTSSQPSMSPYSVILERVNPPIESDCFRSGLNVAIVADLSESMNITVGDNSTTTALDVLKQAASAYVDALVGSDSSVALFTFASDSPAAGNTDNQPLTSVNTPDQANAVKSSINSWQAGKNTNWDSALRKVANSPAHFDYVLFITDGVPNMFMSQGKATGPNDDSELYFLPINNIASANAIKAKGTRMIVLAVGPQVKSVDSIIQISGSVSGNSSPLKNDYYKTDWDKFAQVMSDMVNTKCQVANVVYVNDDDASGAPVQPVAGTVTSFTGNAGTPIGFTDDMAKSGVPSGYEIAKIDNIDAFDNDPGIDQTITVHLTAAKTISTRSVLRTITYKGAASPLPPAVKQPMDWTVLTNQLTGAVTYSTTGFNLPAVPSPVIDGYTADLASVAALKIDATTTSTEPTPVDVEVNYQLSTQVVNIVYVDDDATGATVTPVAGTTTQLTGPSGTAVGFTEAQAKAGIPAGYNFVKLDNVTTYDYVDRVDQTITVHLSEDSTIDHLVVTRTIHYTGAGSSTPADVVQSVMWTITTNQVTSDTEYTTSSSGYPAVSSRSIDGYKADKAQVDALGVQTPTTVKPASSTVNVTYAPNQQTVNIVYFDDDTKQTVPVSLPKLTGPSGSPVGFTETQAKAGIPAGYVFVKLDNVDNYDYADGADQTITVHLVQGIGTDQLTITRTIHYTGAGAATPPDVVQPVTWTSTTNQVANTTVYTTTGSYPAVPSPAIPGYKPDTAQVDALSLPASTSTRPTDSTVNVTYAINLQIVNVVFVDDENSGNTVTPLPGTKTQLTGPSGGPVGFTEQLARAGVPAGFAFVSLDNVTSYDNNDTADQTITVHLKHALATGQFDVTRTIQYVGAGSDTPTAVIQKVSWSSTTDQATGVTKYTAASTEYPAVTSPDVAGYQVNTGTVPALAVTSPTDTRPVSTVVTVTYSPNTQTVNIVYVNDESSYAIVAAPAGATTKLTGPSGSPVGFTEQTARTNIPAGYVFQSLDNVETYDFADADDQTITIHLIPARDEYDMKVSRTIHYQGAGSSTPAAVVQTITWAVAINQAAGTTTYTTTSTGYPALDSPVIKGYAPDVAKVEPQSVTQSTTTAPVSSDIYVKYSPNSQVVDIIYVNDDAKGAAVTPNAGTVTNLTGPSGSAIGFTEQNALAGIPAGYVFVGLDNVANFDFDDAAAQTITVHLTEGHDTGRIVVHRTIHYTGAGSQTPAAAVQPMIWQSDTNMVTKTTTYTTTDKDYPAVTSPVIDGYKPDVAKVDALPVASPIKTAPQPVDVTVTYALTTQVVNVIYVDDDAAGKTVTPPAGATTKLTGPSGSAVGFLEQAARDAIPTNYVFRSLDNVTTYDFQDAVDQTITIHVGQGKAVYDMQVSRTIHYQGAGSATPADVIQKITWTVTTNQVTKASSYATSAVGYAAVTSPHIDGYQPDVAIVTASTVASPSNTAPVSVDVYVKYAPTQQTVNVIYVDNDAAGKVVTPAAGATTKLTGPSGSAIGFTEDAARLGTPENYVYFGLDNVAAFDYVDGVDQTITVHLSQGHKIGQLIVSRTVHYTGAGDATPADVVQPITWQSDTNLVSGVVVYTTKATGYDAVVSPVLTGFTVDIAQVNEQTVPPVINDVPAPQDVTVTYTPVQLVSTGGSVTGGLGLLWLIASGTLVAAGVGLWRKVIAR